MKKHSKIISLIITLTLGLMLLSGCGDMMSSIETSNEPAAKGDLSYYQTLEEDELETMCKYQYIEVSGVVSYAGGSLLYIGERSDGLVAHTSFSYSDKDTLDQIEKGDYVTVQGKCSGVSGNTLTMHDCALIDRTAKADMVTNEEPSVNEVADADSTDESSVSSEQNTEDTVADVSEDATAESTDTNDAGDEPSDSIDAGDSDNTEASSEQNANTSEEPPVVITEEKNEQESKAVTYILNTSSKKFHKPYCSSVSKISDKNKAETNKTRSELINEGYEPCKNCNP